jgi:osmotically-inducible protein OsmY
MRRLVCTIALLLIPVLPLSAATRATAAEPSTTSGAQRFSDAEIEQKVRTKLAKSKIGKDGFVAHVKGGVVTWEGRTAVPQHKGAATRMAKSAGAVRVVNNIRVNDGVKPGQPLHRAHVEGESE